MYDLIIGKQTMHDLRVVLDIQEKTIKIDKILLLTRIIANLQLKPRITRALMENTCFAQEPISNTFGYKFVSTIQIVVYQFVRETTAKKNPNSEK